MSMYNNTGGQMIHIEQMRLKALIEAAPLENHTDQEVYSWLTGKNFTRSKGERQTTTDILAKLGVSTGYAIIEKIKTAAESDPKLQFIFDLMQPQNGGIDLSHAESIAFINQLDAAQVLTFEEAELLKSVGLESISRAEQEGFGVVDLALVQKVRA